MKHHSYLLLCAILLLSSIALPCLAQSSASSVLNGLQFDAPQSLWRPKGNTANLRTRPNAKAPKAKIYKRERTWICKGELVNDIGNDPNWVTTVLGGKTVYISKSVMENVESAPITADVFNNYYTYLGTDYGPEEDPDDVMQWRIGKIKNSELYLCEGQPYYAPCRYIMLGKMIDNVLVFKYRVPFENGYTGDDLMPIGKYFLEFEYDEWCGDNLCYFKHNKGMVKKIILDEDSDSPNPCDCLDLTKMTETMVYAIFKDKIQKNEVDYFYLNSTSFSKDFYRNIVL